MGADVSRIRMDPLKDFGGVVLQQGRLLLDADFNEYVAVLDRRLRAETSDLTSFGPDPDHAGVAWVPRLTPDGFRVTAAGGALTIGRGRMYVDGLLAENHGLEPAAFDPLLSEVTGTIDVPYDQQPYWPTPDPLPAGGPHLAYLDVWQREVTHLEDPDLVERAVGVDTSARLQTVWQVRLLPNVGSGACNADDADLPGWLDIIRPSAGRLTTGTIAIDPDVDPCQLPPTGGYRGLENQTYRVEIHDAGPPGTATFKWSRDNGSVAVPAVELVSPTVLGLASVGRDDVLRISTDDWVEILDDHRELDQRPGVMRRVTVDDAEQTITFSGALPADLQPADADELAARHLRVRRWDQSGVVTDGTGAVLEDVDAGGSDGLITVPAATTTQVALEHGIVVSFSVSGPGGFRAGDHWVFAARTADTSLEALDEAPPHGIHHHYARLATVTFPGSETDCRRLWPPLDTGGEDCSCTVCVTPESHRGGTLTVQGAVDLVGATGGTICLAPGVYDVGDGVTVDGARSLRIRGHGPNTMLVARGTALRVTASLAVTVESLAAVGGISQRATIALRNVAGATVQDVVALSYGKEDVRSSAIELSGVILATAVRRSVLVGRVGINGSGPEIGVFASALRIEDNIVGGIDGIDLGGRSLYLLSCRVSANEVVAGTGTAITATGAVTPGGTLDVTANRILTVGSGIAVGGDVSVVDNAVNAFGEGRRGRDGIVVTSGGLGERRGRCRIVGNRVHGLLGRAIALEVPVDVFMVKQNMVSEVGEGIVVDGKGRADTVAVDNNVVRAVEATDLTGASVFGIAVTNARRVDVAANDVAGVGLGLVEGTARAGIAVFGCADVRVAGNAVQEVGPAEGFVGLAAGVAVLAPFERATVVENSVRHGVRPDGPVEGTWVALLVTSPKLSPGLLGPRGAVAVDDGAVILTRGWAYAVAPRGDHAIVSGNAAAGGGRRPACVVTTRGDVVVDSNQCSHVGEDVGMLVGGRSATVSTNRVRGGRSMLVIETDEDRFAAVGNLAAGGTHLGGPGNQLPSPWDALNPMVP